MAGKPKAHRAKRDDILDAAVTLLLAGGYEAVSMEAVAQAAGVSRRTLFNQFQSKEALFASAVGRVWAQMPFTAITAERDALDDPALGLTRIGTAITAFWTPDASVALARMVVREAARFPSLAQNYLALGKVPTLNILIGYLEALVKANLLSIDDPDLAARQFVGMITEPLVWLRVLGLEETPTPERCDEVVREAVATFLSRYGRV